MSNEITKEELLRMELGAIIKFNSADPAGKLREIHRVFGGWIYLFRERHTGFHRESTALTSQFVPEELNVNTKQHHFDGG